MRCFLCKFLLKQACNTHRSQPLGLACACNHSFCDRIVEQHRSLTALPHPQSLHVPVAQGQKRQSLIRSCMDSLNVNACNASTLNQSKQLQSMMLQSNAFKAHSQLLHCELHSV